MIELSMKKGYSEELLHQLEDVNAQMAALTEKDWREKRTPLNMKFHMLAYSPCADHMAYQLLRGTSSNWPSSASITRWTISG